MSSMNRAKAIVSAVALAIALGATTQAGPVKGRYVCYGNGLSQILGVAELEVWSGGKNVVAGRGEDFTLHCITDRSDESVRACFRNITDGNTNTLEKWPKTGEFNARGMGYSDNSLSHCAFEVDLGKTMPIDRIDFYRSRILFDGRPYKMFGDLGWRYLLVLDQARRIVAWEAWNNYQVNYSQHKGHWSFEMKPATGAPANRLVPAGSLSWLSEAEYIRDFLGKPVTDTSAELSNEDRARLDRFEQRNEPAAIRALGEKFFPVVDLDRPGLEQVKKLVDRERYGEALEAFKAPFFKAISVLDRVYNKFEYTWYADANSRVGMRGRDLSNRVYADKKALTVTRFIPGLLPPAKISMPFQMRPLLLSYVSTGEPEMLRAWEAMTDDWALGFQDAADADPKNLRDHFVLSGNPVMANLMDLHNASRENPDFVREVSGATIARFLLPMLEEIPVANWPVSRKCVFNHIFNSVNQGWALSQAWADFYRVYIDGEEWDLGQTWHGRGMWSVPLAKGLHHFMVTFADARAKDIENQRVDLWRGYPEPATTWRGVAPVLEVSGPGLPRQSIPDGWLKH